MQIGNRELKYTFLKAVFSLLFIVALQVNLVHANNVRPYLALESDYGNGTIVIQSGTSVQFTATGNDKDSNGTRKVRYYWYVDGVYKQYNSWSYKSYYSRTFTLASGVYEKEFTVKVKVYDNEGSTRTKTMTVLVRNENRHYYLTDHLGSVRTTVSANTNNNGAPIQGGTIQGAVTSWDDYYPYGLPMPGRSVNTTNTDALNKFTGHEMDSHNDLNLTYAGARYLDPEIGRWLSVDPLADLFHHQSPYMAMNGNPINMIDPTGMAAEPVYDLKGNHLGNTVEGFTGEVLIYSGDKEVDFSKMSAADAKRMDGVDTYDNQRSTLSNDAKSSIWNNIVSNMEGAQVYDEIFSMNSIVGGIQYADFSGSWGVPTSQAGKGRGHIYGSDKYGYETTVENIQSSVVVHEWYSHMQKGNRDAMKSHRLAYKNVINYKALWNKTTDRYKGFNMIQLRNYTYWETGRTKVD